MREFLIEEKLKKTLKKIYRKDNSMYDAIMKKMNEIISCEDVNHYKNLKKPLQDFKRVHVKSSFVLTFKYSNNKIIFYNFKHHDKIYN